VYKLNDEFNVKFCIYSWT